MPNPAEVCQRAGAKGDAAPARRLPQRLGWLLAAIVAVVLALQADGFIHSRFTGAPGSTTRTVAARVSETATAWPLFPGLVIFAIGWRWHRKDWRRFGLILFLATALAGLSSLCVRCVVGRTRPRNTVEQGWFGPYHNGHWIVGRSDYNSFPSGHTATATGFAFALFLLRSRWRWPAIGWAIAVAWSRIALNNHYFSDTVAASFFGLFSAWLVVQWVDSEQFLQSRFGRAVRLADKPASPPTS